MFMSLTPHLAVVIQNTTFGRIQGFTRKPATAWYNDDGTFGGIVHQERGWTYVLVDQAGHLIPRENAPSVRRSPFEFAVNLNGIGQAYTFARDFIVGNSKRGLVVNASTSAIGGEDAKLEGPVGDILRAADGIYTGNGTATSTVYAPSETIKKWNNFIATRWEARPNPTSTKHV
jgi:carboxypeptidase D